MGSAGLCVPTEEVGSDVLALGVSPNPASAAWFPPLQPKGLRWLWARDFLGS